MPIFGGQLFLNPDHGLLGLDPDPAPHAAARAEAETQQHRPARALTLRARAGSLEAEASTWALLEHLHADPDRSFPGGAGGPPLPGCGGDWTAAQRIAQLLATTPELNWCVYYQFTQSVLALLGSCPTFDSINTSPMQPPCTPYNTGSLSHQQKHTFMHMRLFWQLAQASEKIP